MSALEAGPMLSYSACFPSDRQGARERSLLQYIHLICLLQWLAVIPFLRTLSHILV